MKWISSLKTRTKLNDNVLYSEYLTDTRYINLHSSKVTYLGVYGTILCSSAWLHHKTRANFFTPCLFIPHLFGRSPLTECSSCNLFFQLRCMKVKVSALETSTAGLEKHYFLPFHRSGIHTLLLTSSLTFLSLKFCYSKLKNSVKI